jgi:hypothetical protein
MTAQSITLAGRRAAERLMVDTCAITRVTSTVTNPDTGQLTRTSIPVYTGKCRLKLPVAIGRPDDVGGAQEFTQHPILSLPATTTGVQIDDLVTITASALMPSLVGRVFHVRAQPGQSHMTAARFEILEAMG